MIREDLIAERIATDSCREMVPYDRIDDPTTRTVLEGSLIGKRKPVIGVGNLASMLTGFRATTGRLKAIFIGRERIFTRSDRGYNSLETRGHLSYLNKISTL